MQSQNGNGALAERLGTGLQNLLQRFDSARHLKKMPLSYLRGIFRFWTFPHLSHIFGGIKKAYGMFPAGQVENFRSAFQHLLAKITQKCGKFAFGNRAKVLIPIFFSAFVRFSFCSTLNLMNYENLYRQWSRSDDSWQTQS